MVFNGIKICCPRCKNDLKREGNKDLELLCTVCGKRYPVILGIPDFRIFPDPYIDIEADWAKGKKIAERFDNLDFEGLIDFYYSTTDVVPPQHAKLYKRGLLAAVGRTTAALALWEKMAKINGQPAQSKLLEIGCGTAPLLVAASSKYNQLIGVDIAFRWLIVAKKRLTEAGLDDIPLICACAEDLPFPDTNFDYIVADSVIEHLKDQAKALTESQRVLRSGGQLFIATPNKYSLGPDPHAGIWAGGYLPYSWLAAYVQRQGGIPPKRHLLSVRSLTRLIQRSGFESPQISLPNVSEGQRSHFGQGMRHLINLYQTFKQLPVSREILYWIGPLLYAVSQKSGTLSSFSSD